MYIYLYHRHGWWYCWVISNIATLVISYKPEGSMVMQHQLKLNGGVQAWINPYCNMATPMIRHDRSYISSCTRESRVAKEIAADQDPIIQVADEIEVYREADTEVDHQFLNRPIVTPPSSNRSSTVTTPSTDQRSSTSTTTTDTPTEINRQRIATLDWIPVIYMLMIDWALGSDKWISSIDKIITVD
ncbi:hypothetical protein DFA_06279 [Cavenderia fasciculata]|uniref:Uncharacterized protein n=1 Tax=Cavenderia fasciculata TaxID=261658 RepID=F4PKL2_CACFS|nr:uncharacterized protein DFA_06279 [Cavenderia fasciculata]EGG24136.1 hypothetical protein DFA_06279 [Cavenderia fasciculata]|eukprot:XP_004361987.1 hypothetical protein DFA_06279 [Cavenderia fasciculata]